MRFYNIVIEGGPAGLNGPFTSYKNGAVDLGALNVEFDIPVTYSANPVGFASVRIWGISLQTISQAADFNKSTIKVYAGMSKGLPLANPQQQGLILKGTIFQAFGNWIGTDQTLDLIVATDAGANHDAPVNLVFNWTSGQKLADAIKQALSTGFPTYPITISISPDIFATQTVHGQYFGLEDFSKAILDISKSMMKTAGYPGVDMTLTPQGITVSDGTQKSSDTTSPNNSSSTSQSTTTTTQNGSAKKLVFSDLIGQPTWIGPGQVQFNTVMRADISMFDEISFPPLQATKTASEMGQQAKDHSSFQGTFRINLIRHVGNYRMPQAQGWITTFNCFNKNAPIAVNGT